MTTDASLAMDFVPQAAALPAAPVPLRCDATLPPPIGVEALFKRCLGNAPFAHLLLAEFEATGKRRVDEILALAVDEELLGAAQAAHSLKGAAATIGAEATRRLAAEIETAGRAGQSRRVLDLARELRCEMDRCLAFIPTIPNVAQQR